MNAAGTVRAAIGYTERTGKKPYFYANAHEKDYVPLKPAEVEIADARGLATDLDREGFSLVEHKSALEDLTDLDAVLEVHSGEIADLLKRVTGCDHVDDDAARHPALLRAARRERAHDNSHPARFVHVDMSKEAAAAARDQGRARGQDCRPQRAVQRLAGALRSAAGRAAGAVRLSLVRRDDLIDCEAIFDPPAAPRMELRQLR